MSQDIRKIVKEGYERGDYASHFRTNSQPGGLEKQFLDLLAANLPENARILDLGCGTGIPFDTYLAARGFKITGVDVAHQHIEQARKNVSSADYIEGDFSRMDFGGRVFHAILALYSIFHIPREEHEDLFGKMHSLLKSGGLVLMTLGASAGESVEEDWTGAPMAWSSYDPAIYKAMIARAGLEIAESRFEGEPGDKEYHWWVLAKKV